MNIAFCVVFTHFIDRNTAPGETPKDLDPGA